MPSVKSYRPKMGMRGAAHVSLFVTCLEISYQWKVGWTDRVNPYTGSRFLSLQLASAQPTDVTGRSSPPPSLRLLERRHVLTARNHHPTPTPHVGNQLLPRTSGVWPKRYMSTSAASLATNTRERKWSKFVATASIILSTLANGSAVRKVSHSAAAGRS